MQTVKLSHILGVMVCGVTGFLFYGLVVLAIIMLPLSFQLLFPESPGANAFSDITGSGRSLNFYLVMVAGLFLFHKWSLERVRSCREEQNGLKSVRITKVWQLIGTWFSLSGLLAVISGELGSMNDGRAIVIGMVMVFVGVVLIFPKKNKKRARRE